MTCQAKIIVAVIIFAVQSVADVRICRVYQRAAVAAAANVFLRTGGAGSGCRIGMTAGGANIFFAFT